MTDIPQHIDQHRFAPRETLPERCRWCNGPKGAAYHVNTRASR